MLGAEEARQDLNIMTGTFTLNNHFATTLFDSVAEQSDSFVSTTFIPLLGINPSELGFRYEIEIASGHLVEIDKLIKGCKLEIEGHAFYIDLISFGHESFDVIIGERPKEKMRLLISAKASDKKQEEIVVVRDFPEIDDLNLPTLRVAVFLQTIDLSLEPISKCKRMTSKDLRLEHRLAGYYLRFIENFSKTAKSLTILTQKSKTFGWGEEQELAFKTLKDKLCNASVLALPDGPKDFVKELNMQQRHWIELFSDYDCEIRYHHGKVNVVADALSRKERVKPKRVRAMNMTLQSSIKDRILAAQKEVMDEYAGLQKGLDKMIKQRSDETLYYLDRIWVPLKGEVRTLIMDEAYKSKCSVHPGADKMYYDLRDRYWWLGMKKE
ncbi:putative reverse transcriptase domain-containing protein [Tanacetum coccineum]